MPDAPAAPVTPIVDSAPLPPAVAMAPLPPELPLGADAAVWVLPLLFVLTFLLGSIPWGVIVSRAAFHKDIRTEGSGNIGTTNAMRTLGKAGGVAVFVLDFGKGLLSGYLGAEAAAALPVTFAWAVMALAFAGCTWGHIFSPWLGFKGGKGIAVAVGALFFVFGPVGAGIEIAIFAVVVVATRYVSAGSLTAAVACPVLALWFYGGHWLGWAIILVVALTVIWAHRGNIARLRAGTESRIGGAKEAKGEASACAQASAGAEAREDAKGHGTAAAAEAPQPERPSAPGEAAGESDEAGAPEGPDDGEGPSMDEGPSAAAAPEEPAASEGLAALEQLAAAAKPAAPEEGR